MVGLLSVLAFGVALVLHLLKVDAFIVHAFTLGGLLCLALSTVWLGPRLWRRPRT